MVIDALAGAYGWTKDAIFEMFPAEVEILVRRIRARKEQEDDKIFLMMIQAALAPHTKDGGQQLIKTIMAKHKKLDVKGVTAETIASEMAIARRMLQR